MGDVLDPTIDESKSHNFKPIFHEYFRLNFFFKFNA